MTRKDTILVAVLINAVLLSVLFVTAIIYDTDKGLEQSEETVVAVSEPLASLSPSVIEVQTPTDEVDHVLHYYAQAPSNSNEVPQDIFPLESVEEPVSTPSMPVTPASVIASSSHSDYIEVTVKKGDVLEKIAKNHRTSVSAIKKLNQLQSERLSIGQVLKVPAKKEETLSSTLAVSNAAAQPSSTRVAEHKPESIQSSEPVYYTIKSGDNPWKIAKQFGVKFDDIVRLNNLDEDKARNLKVGDRIRVK